MDGLTIGFLSAMAWGLSVLGGTGWNSVLKFFAALFAVISLGYLTSIESVCSRGNSAILCEASRWIGGILQGLI